MERYTKMAVIMLALALLLFPAWTKAHAQRWSEAQANAWYAQQPWLVGSNYVPTNAINQLEMWQAETFDPQQIDKEFGWAEGLGMNTMRVFLHDLLWQQDSAAFTRRIDTFLTIADKHHIHPVFVLFDSCWEAEPKLGPQHPPIPGALARHLPFSRWLRPSADLPSRICGICSKKFTADIRMRRSTFWSREGHPCVRWYPGPSANCSSANRAATRYTSSTKWKCIATTTRTWTGTRKGCVRECGSSVGTSSVLWDRREMRMRVRRTCILRSSSWGRRGCGGRGRPLTHTRAW